MTTEHYHRIHSWFGRHPAVRHWVVRLDRWLPLVPFVCYPVLLILINVQLVQLFCNGAIPLSDALDFMSPTARAILVPGFTFLLGTLVRDRLNCPRPYEQPGFEPLVQKETHGHSLPSRHALSAFVLAMVWLYFYPAAGCGMLFVAAAICTLRVLTGVHHVRDVVCGALFGILFGYAGMWLL